jgi:hypothetical protein
VRGAGLALLPVIVVLLLAVMVLACGLRAAGRPRSHVGTRWSRSFVMPNRVTHSVHRPGAKEATSNEQLVTRVVIFITGNPRGDAPASAHGRRIVRVDHVSHPYTIYRSEIPVKCGARVALGVAGGYFLGQTNKIKLALVLSGMAAGRQAGGPGQILAQDR